MAAKNVLTVREAVQRAREDGLAVSEYSLRQWIKAGKLPSRQAGQKMLLYYPNLVRFIQCEDGGDNIPEPAVYLGGIRRVGV